jgi:hypothetical protein
MLHIGFVGMFTMHVSCTSIKSYFVFSKGLLTITIKVKAKCRLRDVAMLLLYILHKNALAKSAYFFKYLSPQKI